MNHRLRLLWVVVAWTGCATLLTAQLNIGGTPYSFRHELPADRTYAAVYTLPKPDMEKINAEDRDDALYGRPPRFGYAFPVDIRLDNSGDWITLENGDRLWTLQIACPGARSINLSYEDFWLPPGAVLYLYNADKTHVIGGFTAKNNKGAKENRTRFGTGLVYGDQITLEYYEPMAARGMGEIDIARVVHGYRYVPLPGHRDLGDSGPCNVNVNCPEGADWSEEKNSVALTLVNGDRWCTGSLMSTTVDELTPYFLTADHCLGPWANIPTLDAVTNPDASDWTFYWNYESPGCPDLLSDFTPPSSAGAVVVANNPASDFALLRLTEDPSETAADLLYNGWDATGDPVSSAVGIHHPMGDIKKISIESNALISTNYGSETPTGAGSHWMVSNWNVGVTEEGSSGSPLYSPEHLVVGQLDAGFSACNGENDNGEPDWYGKLSVSWDGDGDANFHRRLQDWLAPECEFNIHVSDIIIEETPAFVASNNITANDWIFPSYYVVFQAGNSITLQPGFWAAEGSTFRTILAPCDVPSSAPKKTGTRGPNQGGTVANRAVAASDDSSEQTPEPEWSVGLTAVPNPFRENTVIQFYLEQASAVTIEIFSLAGTKVAEPLREEYRTEGAHSVRFIPEALAPGVYLCRLNFGDDVRTIRLVYSK